MKMKIKLLAIACVSFALLSGCRENPQTYAIHTPIYPNANQDVTFTLRLVSGTAKSVALYETVSVINSSGTVTSTGSETGLMAQGSSGSLTFPISFTKTGGYPANRLVTYRFEVKGDKNTYNHRITFATGTYPAANKAVPVYVVGDVNKVFNLVFVPDSDVMNINTFYDAVSQQIQKGFQTETYLNRFRNSFNFYINPHRGRSRDYDSGLPHLPPSNISHLSFAQGVCLLHNADLRDHAGNYSGVSMFSGELLNFGVVLHEAGHGMFGLADEYNGGSHWPSLAQYNGFPYRNNWPNKDSAEKDATKYNGKTTANVASIQSGWWKVCNNAGCAMHNNTLFYDEPCRQRILHKILERASN